jgi:hypothetical protein
MTRDEARFILLRYRPGTSDTKDPQIHEALALAKSDASLAEWWTQQVASQELVRRTFQQIQAPAGLMEQIISEQRSARRLTKHRRRLVGTAVAAIILLTAMVSGFVWHTFHPAPDNTLAVFAQQMTGNALRGYLMDLQTNDAGAIRAFFRGRQAPSDYTLPRPLQRAALIGCSVETWQSVKVSMLCLATGARTAPGTQNDLWLFVVDQNSVAGAPRDTRPHPLKAGRMAAETWSDHGKLYLLASTADPVVRQHFF